MTKGVVPEAWRDLYSGLIGTIGVLAITAHLVRHERGRLQAVGAAFTQGSGRRLILGLLSGLLLYALIFLVVSCIAGPLTLTSAASRPAWTDILLVIATYLSLSAMEELAFRGFPLRTLTPAIGEWQALLVTALAFGGTHLLYGWPWQTVLMGVVPSGLLFGAAAVASRGLAFPIGLHAALNLTMWGVGEKGVPGLWTLGSPAGAEAGIAKVAPWISLGLTLLGAFLLFRYRDHRVTKILSGASPAS